MLKEWLILDNGFLLIVFQIMDQIDLNLNPYYIKMRDADKNAILDYIEI